MSLSSLTQWEVRSAGSDTNGGGFVAGASGTDYSQQNSANSGGSNSSTTDAVTNGTTTITSATASFTSAIVGNIIYIAGGTGSITGNWYQVVTYTNATTIVVDRSTGLTTGTGATMNIGGALGSPGQLGAVVTVAGMIAWIKYTSGSPYLMTNATANTSGGPVSIAQPVVVQGYDQTRGDRTGNQPVLSWASVAAPGTVTYIYSVAGSPSLVNLAANGNRVNNVGGFSSSSSYGRYLWCTAENCNGTGAICGFNISTFGGSTAVSCNAVSCTTGFLEGSCILCYATLCTTGFNTSYPCVDCVAYDNGTGFRLGLSGQVLLRCTADSNTTSGFTTVASTPCALVDCIASNNTIGITNGSAFVTTANFASYNNTTNVSGSTVQQPLTPITLTAQPYMTAGSQFAPNATPGGGASLRGVATGVYGQTDDKDIGAVHSANEVGLTGLVMMVRGQTVAIH
jgi:hypothetical protein